MSRESPPLANLPRLSRAPPKRAAGAIDQLEFNVGMWNRGAGQDTDAVLVRANLAGEIKVEEGNGQLGASGQQGSGDFPDVFAQLTECVGGSPIGTPVAGVGEAVGVLEIDRDVLRLV